MTNSRTVDVDVLIVGAGVVGTAIARELSFLDVSVAVIERRHDVGEETSKANSGITNCGWSLSPGSLEERLVRESSPVWETLTEQLGVKFRRVGISMLALNPLDAEELSGWCERAAQNGVEASLFRGEDVQTVAPHASSETIASVHIPAEGVVDSVRLPVAYAELASTNGVQFYLGEPLVSADVSNSEIRTVTTPEHTFRARFVVNAAGLGADFVSQCLGGEEFPIAGRRGQWALLDREFGANVPGILCGVPGALGHGPMVIPTAHGSVMLGPTAEDCEDKLDRATGSGTLAEVVDRCIEFMPSIDLKYVTKRFAGVRSNSDRTYRIEWSSRSSNLVQVAGIRSTGVSASPAIARYVRDSLLEKGLTSAPDVNAVDRLNFIAPLWSELDCEAAALEPLGRTVICACEKVTARDIHQALRHPMPATSIEGVARRTHATWGRCQGSACLSGVSFITSLYRQGPAWGIPYHEPGSTLGVGETAHG